MPTSFRVACLLVLCSAIMIMPDVVCHAAPRVQVDKSVYDAGAVPEGNDATHEFAFKNIGDQDLTIKPKPC